MIELTSKGNYDKANSYLHKLLEKGKISWLDKYGRMGVKALKNASPKDSGLMSESWFYTIEHTSSGASLIFHNDDIEHGFHVAIMVQYGHAKKGGGWIDGVDYINPALEPIFEKLKEEAWKEV